ncbi:HTH-type transcriptional regulator NmtR [Pirellulimonas nuda]|uniref:HTH-type transcriptional regulator NmtR n=1 Tax=Pirellulimonas nuda TaxID=2528009 RepID=A0A518DGX1_9BACT|nr:metalloregulator ArsR/SmtB family transcription factor [Pirellulimonas nuda]QDU90724.1 HTH-type transcriptional regulator NmtR [Pirellulimonas nuda]
MSTATRSAASRRLRRNAPLFAALGDPTRLTLLVRLGEDAPLSISQLTEATAVTRQATAKHLRVLQSAGLVRSARRGRETLFHLEPKPLDEARDALADIGRQWDDALGRLKAHVEQKEAGA